MARPCLTKQEQENCGPCNAGNRCQLKGQAGMNIGGGLWADEISSPATASSNFEFAKGFFSGSDLIDTRQPVLIPRV